jgi:hypothetical protein
LFLPVILRNEVTKNLLYGLAGCPLRRKADPPLALRMTDNSPPTDDQLIEHE